MIDITPVYRSFSMFPNNINTYVSHPYFGNSKAIEIGIFNEHRFSYMKHKDIEEIFCLDGDFMSWVRQRIDGSTIALESEHTGGIDKSLKYYSLLENIYFTGSLFRNNNVKWRNQ